MQDCERVPSAFGPHPASFHIPDLQKSPWEICFGSSFWFQSSSVQMPQILWCLVFWWRLCLNQVWSSVCIQNCQMPPRTKIVSNYRLSKKGFLSGILWIHLLFIVSTVLHVFKNMTFTIYPFWSSTCYSRSDSQLYPFASYCKKQLFSNLLVDGTTFSSKYLVLTLLFFFGPRDFKSGFA